MLSFFVHSDLYAAGRTEDGEDFVAKCYYVVAENERGRRWRHQDTFRGVIVRHTEEGPAFVDNSTEAFGHAQRIVETCQRPRVVAIPVETQWIEIDPAYGSEAYTAAEADIVLRERADAR